MMEKRKMAGMMRFGALYAAALIALALFFSCTQMDEKRPEVKMLTLTKTESVCFIQYAEDTLSYKCYAISVDGDSVKLRILYSVNAYVHTHPLYIDNPTNPLGISNTDNSFYKRIGEDIKILMVPDGRLWGVVPYQPNNRYEVSW